MLTLLLIEVNVGDIHWLSNIFKLLLYFVRALATKEVKFGTVFIHQIIGESNLVCHYKRNPSSLFPE